jgi:hypothetical protein
MPQIAEVVQGRTAQFDAEVTGNGEFSTAVNWSVTGHESVSISEYGLLTVPQTVPPDTILTIRATSATTPRRFGEATITVLELQDGVTKITVDPAAVEVSQGRTQQFNATIEGIGEYTTDVAWSVYGHAAASITPDGLLTVPVIVPYNTIITVRATSVTTPGVSGSAYITVIAPTHSVMGVEWNYSNSSPALVRLEDSVGKNATSGVGTVAGHSDFDLMPIYKDIRRCVVNAAGVVLAYEGESGFSFTPTTGDVMVEIPLFYYRVEDDRAAQRRREWISDTQLDGYLPHPAFARPFGTVPKIYIGAFETGAGHVSRSGLAPLVSQTRAQFRTGARGKGTIWSVQDLTTRMAIEMLIRIEFANLNTQAAIAAGNTSSSAALATGRTNTIAGHTGREAGTNAATVSFVWRGIENLWGNVWEWVDGFNINAGQMLFSNNPANYADDTAANYTPIGIALPASGTGTFTTRFGFNSAQPWAALPDANTGGSETTFLCDTYWFNASGWRVAFVGGHWNNAGRAGLFAWHLSDAATLAHATLGARLLCIPR